MSCIIGSGLLPRSRKLETHTVFSRAQTGKVLGEPSVQIATPIIGSGGEFLGYAEEGGRRRVWWAAAFTGVTALVISAGVSTWLAARFRRVASHIKALGIGNLETAISNESSPWEPHEFQAMQHELSLLAGELASHRRSLKKQVEARTAELAQSNERLNLLIHALERAEDGIAIINGSAEFMYVNQPFSRSPGTERMSCFSAPPANYSSTLRTNRRSWRANAR